ncbi:ABC transporter permease [Pedobacter boryungensis]|uniref:ABC transporter permease n=1 Tax=Pedobacter boryungensis TaxID=869962 RepID=A0ABX2D8K0_9SPHI|nr:ABC transporter permease [Pedobacter boryungensis]NQX30391.1 ABC transporter permease [Pedobacter boryungensis]
MFKLNLKIAWRNLWKNKAYSAINIFGLAAGLAGFMIILLYINKETGYDKWNPDLKRTYIVAADFTKNGSENKGSKIKGLLSNVITEQISEVNAVSIGNIEGRKLDVRIKKEDKENSTQFEYASVDSNFFKVYPLQAYYGKMEDIYLDQNFIAISYTAAEKMFGTTDVLNKVLINNRGVNAPEASLVIKAVWDDRKQPSSFGFDLIFKENLDEYGNQLAMTPFTTIFKLKDGMDQEKTIQKINDAYIIAFAKMQSGNSDANFSPTKSQALKILNEKEGITAIKLITEPIANLNLSSFYTSNPKQTTIYILCALASFLIIISCINYTNLALVLAQTRAKEVGVKKVLGAFKSSLIHQFFSETGIQCIISFLLALIFAELILPQVNQILSDNLTLFGTKDVWLILGQVTLILIGIMLLSGAYPALVLAGFLPAKVLKGNFSSSTHIGSLRKVLVVFQFTVAIALVISFGVIYAQLNFMKQKDLGLKKNQLMSVRIAKYETRHLNPAGFEGIKNRLLAIKGVEDVTRATEQPINDSGFSDDITFNNTTLSVESRFIDPNYFETIGAKIIQGRSYNYNLLSTDSVQSIVLNETAVKQLGLSKTDHQISITRNGDKVKVNVVGIVKDIQAYGFDKEIMPTAYLVNDYPTHWRANVIFRLSTQNLHQTMANIKAAWAIIDTGAQPKFVYADEVFAKMNNSYEVSEKIIFSFGIVTLMVSIFGLIGFAAFNAKMRIKEIAVRRILGATTTSLLKLLNIGFVKLVIVSMLLADVLAYIYMQKWFNEFAYRIPMPFGIFIIVNLSIILLTILTVSWQSIRAIKENPVKALKYE